MSKNVKMFCNQCQETAKNEGCTIKGVCGKDDRVSNLQDLLIYVLQGIALLREKTGKIKREEGVFICRAVFSTITNANFSDKDMIKLISEAVNLRDSIKKENNIDMDCPPCNWSAEEKDYVFESASIGILSYSKDEDIRSLKSTILYGIKGISAYTTHAAVLGYYDESIFDFIVKGLAALAKDMSMKKLTSLVFETGQTAVKAMKILDQANTSAYGHPEITAVSTGVRNNPGILISGHDLKDMEELLKQTESSGVDVYTHSEMLPAHYYPAFKKYSHLAGNYGGSWWRQNTEFESFNGPILMTTNCIVPVKDSYKDRIFTTGTAGYPGVKHISEDPGGTKDFSEIIELAKKCSPPTGIEEGTITGGFAHNQLSLLSGKIIEAVKSGAVKRFVVMAGCDGRMKDREYFSQLARNLPSDTLILTAGCAKYRYNKLELGDIGGIPRVIDAGQCNDSYSLVVIALKLKEAFGADSINDLPISFDIAWYEQKAVAILLALLDLGIKNIILGPTLPAFLSENVAALLVEETGIRGTNKVKDDIAEIMS
ncbi:MAG: hydroxylamine reductase [Elusimicrobiota bacterium]